MDELPAGSSTVNNITLAGGTLSGPGGIQWDGTHLDIGDSTNGTIYQTDGLSILSSVNTTATCQGGFFLTGNHRRAIVPDLCTAQTGIYRYPAGGAPLKTASGGQVLPHGVGLSAGPR